MLPDAREAQGAESELASGIGPVGRSAGRVKQATPLLDKPKAHRLIENGLGGEQLREPAYRIRPAASVPVRRNKSRRNLGCGERMKASGGRLLADGRNLLLSSSCNFGRRRKLALAA